MEILGGGVVNVPRLGEAIRIVAAMGEIGVLNQAAAEHATAGEWRKCYERLFAVRDSAQLALAILEEANVAQPEELSP